MSNEQALREALRETLLFCETFSNRWDGETGAHPFDMVERARQALATTEPAVNQQLTTDPFDEREAFEKWLGIKPCGAAHDFGWAAWQARAAMAQVSDINVAESFTNDTKDAESWIASALDFDGWRCSLEPLYTAQPAAPAMAPWQPIETAPKDGSDCWLLVEEEVRRGFWVEIEFEERRDLDGRYIDQTDDDAYWMDKDSGDPLEPTMFYPITKPLPPAPAMRKGQL